MGAFHRLVDNLRAQDRRLVAPGLSLHARGQPDLRARRAPAGQPRRRCSCALFAPGRAAGVWGYSAEASLAEREQSVARKLSRR